MIRGNITQGRDSCTLKRFHSWHTYSNSPPPKSYPNFLVSPMFYVQELLLELSYSFLKVLHHLRGLKEKNKEEIGEKNTVWDFALIKKYI